MGGTDTSMESTIRIFFEPRPEEEEVIKFKVTLLILVIIGIMTIAFFIYNMIPADRSIDHERIWIQYLYYARYTIDPCEYHVSPLLFPQGVLHKTVFEELPNPLDLSSITTCYAIITMAVIFYVLYKLK